MKKLIKPLPVQRTPLHPVASRCCSLTVDFRSADHIATTIDSVAEVNQHMLEEDLLLVAPRSTSLFHTRDDVVVDEMTRVSIFYAFVSDVITRTTRGYYPFWHPLHWKK